MEPMARREFVDPDPLLTEKLQERVHELEKQYPEPRSGAGDRRLKRARRRILREFHVARGTTAWLSPGDHPAPRAKPRQ